MSDRQPHNYCKAVGGARRYQSSLTAEPAYHSSQNEEQMPGGLQAIWTVYDEACDMNCHLQKSLSQRCLHHMPETPECINCEVACLHA